MMGVVAATGAGGEVPESLNLDFSAFAHEDGFERDLRVRVIDALTRLEVERSRVVDAMERGQRVAARFLGRGPQEINLAMAKGAGTWRVLESIRSSGTVEQLSVSLPNNAYHMERGLRMISVWHRSGLDPDVRLMLAAEDPSAYFFSYAPVQLKIIDRRSVLLEGPSIGGKRTVIDVEDQACLAAARGYWDAVVSGMYPCDGETAALADLTVRQRRVIALMLTSSSDEEISRKLGVSVRTVRTEIALVLSMLEAPNRFVAGVRLRERLGIGPLGG
ncbi:sigma factor-like helix-turn-helix DNA-binding protein [Promicromonospora sp. MS192]|uniref:sigma factor-like helix-turn-helix DNA-binding protein n=1 Tax=Promicromonospora sp. MS192 TaxID=3412684 RepID=UPI003C2EC230